MFYKSIEDFCKFVFIKTLFPLLICRNSFFLNKEISLIKRNLIDRWNPLICKCDPTIDDSMDTIG